MRQKQFMRNRSRSVLLAAALIGFFLLIASGCANFGARGPASSAEFPDSWQLVWHDEFSGEGALDAEKWNIERLGPGFYNHELQMYTDRMENVRREEGVLIIEAHPIPGTKLGYTSARIHTKNRHNMLEGRVEIRARLPQGKGTWPALWMLPVNSGDRTGWPHSGEIDIVEHVGYDPGTVHASVHTSTYNWLNGNNFTTSFSVPDAQAEFHIYALEWTQESLDFSIDDYQFAQYRNDQTGWEAWPFDVPFYLVMNLAVGGDWGGAQGVSRDEFPARLEVDWVRVYQQQ